MNARGAWETTVLTAIEESADELLALAGDLPRIPTGNPPGDCPQIGRVVEGYLRAAGLDAGSTGRLLVLAAPRPEP